MQFDLKVLHNWGDFDPANVKAILRLYTSSTSGGPALMTLQHLENTTWADDGGASLKWDERL